MMPGSSSSCLTLDKHKSISIPSSVMIWNKYTTVASSPAPLKQIADFQKSNLLTINISFTSSYRSITELKAVIV